MRAVHDPGPVDLSAAFILAALAIGYVLAHLPLDVTVQCTGVFLMLLGSSHALVWYSLLTIMTLTGREVR